MKFEIGKTYFTRSICDHDMIITITVASRTAKRIKTTEGKTLGVSEYEGIEQVRPWGRYSMCPVIGADRPVKTEAEAPAPVQVQAVEPAPTSFDELMAEGEKLFTPEQFTDLKNMLGGLLGVAIQTPAPAPAKTAKIYDFNEYRRNRG
jgi:hypothetical protein